MNAIALVAAKALPALSGSSLTYNPEKNVFLTCGYTSAAGNTYYKAIRISDRLAAGEPPDSPAAAAHSDNSHTGVPDRNTAVQTTPAAE